MVQQRSDLLLGVRVLEGRQFRWARLSLLHEGTGKVQLGVLAPLLLCKERAVPVGSGGLLAIVRVGRELLLGVVASRPRSSRGRLLRLLLSPLLLVVLPAPRC